MFISTCLAYSDVQFEINQLKEVYILTVRSVEDQAVSFTLNYIQAKVLSEGISGFLSQTLVQSVLDANNGILLGDASFRSKLLEAAQTDQKGEEESCQLPNLSARMATAS